MNNVEAIKLILESLTKTEIKGDFSTLGELAIAFAESRKPKTPTTPPQN